MPGNDWKHALDRVADEAKYASRPASRGPPELGAAVTAEFVRASLGGEPVEPAAIDAERVGAAALWDAARVTARRRAGDPTRWGWGAAVEGGGRHS